jgi:hypothetical protein
MHTCSFSYLEKGSKKIESSRSAGPKAAMRPCLKNKSKTNKYISNKKYPKG